VRADTVGARVASARRKLGLTQKHFAERLGISLWLLDRIEAGVADTAAHLPKIADVTGCPQTWFARGNATIAASPMRPRVGIVSRMQSHVMTGRDMVLASLALLVLIRFFTEVIPVLPRAANFVDIPIFLVLSAAALTRPHENRFPTSLIRLALPVTLFIILAAISVVLNLQRVAAGPALVFLYGFLSPFAVYIAVYRLWPPGNARTLSRFLLALGLIQLAVVALIDVPRFVRTRNPDEISGTFGTNQYQLVFFLLIYMGLLAGIYTFEKGRLAARAAPLLFLPILATIFLAQYRALIATMFLTVVLIALLLGVRGSGLVSAILLGLALLTTFSVVNDRYPLLKLGSTVSTLTRNPGLYVSTRVDTARNVASLFSDDPRFIVTGTGPGTFSSRGWQTFAHAGSASESNVQGPYVRLLTGANNEYRTDVSDKYVTTPYSQGAVIQGSRALISPFSDYLSLLAEVGIGGLVLISTLYFSALLGAGRLTLRLARSPIRGDSLPALAIASTVGFFVLVQMAVLDNWLEVTRVSFLTWTLLAVVHREYDLHRDGKRE